MENGRKNVVYFHPSIKEEVLRTLERYCQSLLRDSRRTVQLEGREITISYLLRKVREALQHSKKMPRWWPSLCEALVRDAVETIVAGIEDSVSVEEILQEEDPLAAAQEIRGKGLEKMGIEDLDLACGEEIYTAEEIAGAVYNKRGIGISLRQNLLFAAAIRVLPWVSS